MKKLLIDINSIVPYYATGRVSGIGRTTLELINALSQIPDIPFEVVLYSQNMKGIGGRNIQLKFETRHLYFPHRENFNKLVKQLAIKELFIKYDLLHVPHNFEYVHSPSKCVVTLHDALFMKIQEKRFNHNKMKESVPPFIQKCKHVITCSKSSKRDIVEKMNIPAEKIDVIYWGINHQTFYPSQNKLKVRQQLNSLFKLNKPYFLSVSCNAERKRTHIIVDVYLKLCQQKELNNDLVLLWENPPQKLLAQVNESQFKGRIHFIKNVNDRELALLYNGSTSLLFISAYEGFGLPIAEAMACGTPVVTCTNSSLKEVGGDAALYIEEPVEHTLPKVLLDIDECKYDINKIASESIKQAQKFDWKETANRYINLYCKLLDI